MKQEFHNAWARGLARYNVSLTWKRSPVQIRAGPYFLLPVFEHAQKSFIFLAPRSLRSAESGRAHYLSSSQESN